MKCRHRGCVHACGFMHSLEVRDIKYKAHRGPVIRNNLVCSWSACCDVEIMWHNKEGTMNHGIFMGFTCPTGSAAKTDMLQGG
jgi:hypothetical protein